MQTSCCSDSRDEDHKTKVCLGHYSLEPMRLVEQLGINIQIITVEDNAIHVKLCGMCRKSLQERVSSRVMDMTMDAPLPPPDFPPEDLGPAIGSSRLNECFKEMWKWKERARQAELSTMVLILKQIERRQTLTHRSTVSQSSSVGRAPALLN